MSASGKIPVHVEVSLTEIGNARDHSTLKSIILQYLSVSCPVFKNGRISIISGAISVNILELVESINICDLVPDQSVSFWQAEICIYLIFLFDSPPEKDFLDGIDGEESTTTAYEQWELPNRHLAGLWDSIVIDDSLSIKSNLLGYCSTSMLFSEALVDPDVISWNRMVISYRPCLKFSFSN